MSKIETLKALEARLVEAKGPARKLDASIHVAVIGPVDFSSEINPQPVDLGDGNYVPLYTSSLDAAVALVEKVLGDKWTIARIIFNQNDNRTWHAELREGYLTSYSSVVLAGGYTRYNSGLPNGALALCLALVRALIAKEEAEQTP